MRPRPSYLLLLGGMQAVCLQAQPILTEATSMPALQRMENHYINSVFPVSALSTSGTDNTWDASGAVWGGGFVYCQYDVPAASPHAALYPTMTLSAYAESNGFPQTYRHYASSSTEVYLLGEGNTPYTLPQQLCEFPFALGDTFITSYQAPGFPVMTDTVEYVASGSITAPWGTMTDVVMFAIDQGTSYLLYKADNVLFPIGRYIPNVSFEVHEVDLFNGMDERMVGPLEVRPSLVSDQLVITLPASSTADVMILGADGRTVRTLRTVGGNTSIAVSDLAAGPYTVCATLNDGTRRTARIVVEH